MAAMQNSILAIDTPVRPHRQAPDRTDQTPGAGKAEKPESRHDEGRDKQDSAKQDKADSEPSPFSLLMAIHGVSEASDAETVVSKTSEALAVSEAEIAKVENKQASETGEALPLEGEALPLTGVVQTAASGVLADKANANPDIAPEKLAEKPVINPTLQQALAKQLNQQPKADVAKPVVAEVIVDGESFFKPTLAEPVSDKPGGLNLLGAISQKSQPIIEEGLTALRNMATVQPTTSANQQAAPPVTPATVDTSMLSERQDNQLLQLNGRTQEFPAKLTQRVAFMVARGIQQAVIRLDPPELGKLEVTVQKEDERVQVQVVTQTPQARELVERNIHQLKQLFAEQGLDLTDTDINQQQQEQAEQDGRSEAATASGEPSSEEHDEVVQALGNQLLDTYA